MPAAHRTVVVMRHAQAEPAGATDVARALTARGRADATAAGAWLASRAVRPDVALVSAAVRTQETWAAVASGAGWSLDPSLDRGLYSAGPDTALDLVRALSDDVASVMLVGHNPTMAYLAALLDDGEGDPAATAHLTAGFPTCSLALFSYDASWADLDAGRARLVAFHVARA
ncbi:histidine phosphatase family protein [Nocardioides sp. cx-169]|uniref:SixA phosphatase family protein n=1 Tax=Nocardioides sp. cx-169 TaxID=2899080 RepID=UPI001E657DFB|nr:histidine phosphatase family protein [Nocardioides sp. cx-169]MCD4535250.1 histidine phosphatase family protein [Nocardioides sp. cx-169]